MNCGTCRAIDLEHLVCKVDGERVGPESEACPAHYTRIEVVRARRPSEPDPNDSTDLEGSRTEAA